MNKRIVDFMDGQKVATICCVDANNNPYCFSCFYAFDKKRWLIYFKSSANSHHVALLSLKPVVAGTIQPDRLNALIIKGIQFNGTIVNDNKDIAASNYHKRYPFAYAMTGEVWIIQLSSVKMTDSTLGFGKKITWQRIDAKEIKVL